MSPSETTYSHPTSAHPPENTPDPTLTSSTASASVEPSSTTTTDTQDAKVETHRQSTTYSSSSAQLSHLTLNLSRALRQFPDFPSPGILFEDICPIFRNPATLNDLITALELFIAPENGGPGKPDLIVGLDARGFLMGPALALRIGAGFAPIRKKGKLPGQVERASFKKEYGEDVFEIQADAVEKGQKVLVIDDIIATGMVFMVHVTRKYR